MSPAQSYTLIAPFYDAIVAAASRGARQKSLAQIPAEPAHVLLAGVGTGLDLPHLPRQHRYVGIDLTAAMLGRALPRAAGLDFQPVRGDVQRLPFADATFDAVVLHLIVAVVPEPAACLAEAARVARPGGRLLVLDKFLRPGQAAPVRRLLNPLLRRIATRLDVVWEEVFAAVPGLTVLDNRPAMAGGWFRRILAVKR